MPEVNQLPVLSVEEKLSLRDEFAKNALAGMLANSENINRTTEPTLDHLYRDNAYSLQYCKLAYKLADHMLAVRNLPAESL